MIAAGETWTDWEKVRNKTEEEIEAAIADDPDWRDIPPDWADGAEYVDPQIYDVSRPRGPDGKYRLRKNRAAVAR